MDESVIFGCERMKFHKESNYIKQAGVTRIVSLETYITFKHIGSLSNIRVCEFYDELDIPFSYQPVLNYFVREDSLILSADQSRIIGDAVFKDARLSRLNVGTNFDPCELFLVPCNYTQNKFKGPFLSGTDLHPNYYETSIDLSINNLKTFRNWICWIVSINNYRNDNTSECSTHAAEHAISDLTETGSYNDYEIYQKDDYDETIIDFLTDPSEYPEDDYQSQIKQSILHTSQMPNILKKNKVNKKK